MPPHEAKKKLKLDPNRQYVLFCDANHDPIKRRDIADLALKHVINEMPDTKLLELNHVPHKMVPLYLNASSCLLVTSEKERTADLER